MRRTVTTTALLALVGWCAVASAQPVRTTEVRWARDVGSATLTLDGTLNEPQWAQAETIQLQWNNPTFHTPGGGWDNFFGNFNANPVPTDPVDATIRLLRRGNILWIGVEARDKSVGGKAIDFWTGDGLIMSITDERNRSAQTDTLMNSFNGNNTDEFFFTYFGADTTAGALPRLFGNHGDDRTLWDGRTTVQGTSNNDSDTDTGYTQEIWIDMSMLGVNMNAGAGDRLPMTFSVFDFDYGRDPGGRQFLSRAWWQNGWGGDMPHGVGYVHGSPAVTTSSGAVPTINTPDLRLGHPAVGQVITVDGNLNEPAWNLLNPQVNLRYQPTNAMLDALPGFGPYYTQWYRPGGDAPGAPTVVDATTGRIRYFFQGSTLYVGLDTDDQAVSGDQSEDRADGIRVIVREGQSANPGEAFPFRGFRVFVDTTGIGTQVEVIGGNPPTPVGLTAAVHLKPGTTVADASDVDAGYQIEMAIDLTTLPGLSAGTNVIYIATNYFDADYLDPDDDALSYGTRTWWLAERGGGNGAGPAAMTYLDPSLTIVSSEASPGQPGPALALLGAAPNPASGTTAVRYVLPTSTAVTVELYDALGRLVTTVETGVQQAGQNEVEIDGAALSAGAYVFRVRTADGAMETGRLTIAH